MLRELRGRPTGPIFVALQYCRNSRFMQDARPRFPWLEQVSQRFLSNKTSLFIAMVFSCTCKCRQNFPPHSLQSAHFMLEVKKTRRESAINSLYRKVFPLLLRKCTRAKLFSLSTLRLFFCRYEGIHVLLYIFSSLALFFPSPPAHS